MLATEMSVDELRGEILQIDADLARLDEQERDAERGIESLALQARRGDESAEKQIGEHEGLRSTVLSDRRRLQAARASVETELRMAQAVAEREATKEKAREAKVIVANLRQRGPNIGQALRTALDEYVAIQSDMAALSGLGMTRINPELAKANCRRAFRAALTPIRAELEMTLVPPLERRAFDELTTAWSDTSERMIDVILHQPEAATSQA